MYAIVRCGGRQEKVALDEVVTVDKLPGEVGSSVTLPALLVVDGDRVISDPAEVGRYLVTADIVGGSGGAAWRRAKANMDEAVAGALEKGRDAASAVREVSDHFVAALDESIKTRPYTTLALVAGLAFILGAAWRR